MKSYINFIMNINTKTQIVFSITVAARILKAMEHMGEENRTFLSDLTKRSKTLR